MVTKSKKESLREFQNRLLQTVVVPKTLEGLVQALQMVTWLVHEWVGPDFPRPVRMRQAINREFHSHARSPRKRLNSQLVLRDYIGTLEAHLAGNPIQYPRGGMLEYDCGDEMVFPYESMFLDALLAQQKLVPGLTTIDIYPPRKLTVERLQLFRDVQIFRGKLIEVDGRPLTDEDRLQSVRMLSRKIPLKLTNPEANNALAKMMARREPFGKAGVRDILLPGLFYVQLPRESTPSRRRLGRTHYVKDHAGAVVALPPEFFSLSAYWQWIKDRVRAALQEYVLELEMTEAGTVPAKAPEFRGTMQGRAECDAWERNGPVELIRLADLDVLRRARHRAITEASPDEVSLDDPEPFDFVAGVHASDFQTFEIVESLNIEDSVSAANIVRAVSNGMPRRDRQYLRALLKVLSETPGVSMSDAHQVAQKKLRITTENRRQIWFRIRRYAKGALGQRSCKDIGFYSL